MQQTHQRQTARPAGVLAFLLVALTCLPETTAQSLPSIRARSGNATAPVIVSSAGRSPQDSRSDVWYRIGFDEQHVGYERLTSTRIDPQGTHSAPGGLVSHSEKSRNASISSAAIHRRRDTRLKLKRQGINLSLTALLETRETSDGTLIEWSLRRTSGDGSTLERSGIWNPELSAYEVSERVQATRRTSRLTAPQQPRSAMISEWAPGLAAVSDRRFRSSVLFPETASIVDMDFEAPGQQLHTLPDGTTISVSRISFWPSVDPVLRTTLLVDQFGQVLTSEQPLLGGTLTLERTDASRALGAPDMESLDLDFATLIPVNRPITDASRKSQIRLRIVAGTGEQLSLPESTFQTVETVSGNELIVTLRRPDAVMTPERLVPSPAEPVAPEYLASTRWINTTDSQVQRLARSAAGGSSVSSESCRRMARSLFSGMKRSPFSTSLLSAGEAAALMRGDCTEHAVLLAAMMRVYGIPSRVAAGFVYSEKTAAFSTHMWTEAWVDNQWIPFDSTILPESPATTRIKVLDSSLSDDVTSGTLLFLPLLNFMGRTRIDVLPESGF